MTLITEQTLYQRHVIVLVLIGIFVVSVVGVAISLIVVSPALDGDDTYNGRKNVLFIVVDDLRPALGSYGDKIAITPNIDQIASKGILFQNAYAQQALGAPSRTSFLTSRRPDSLHLYDAGSYWRDTVGNFVTIPQHFKYHGYETISVGKIFPHGIASNKSDDYPFSWSVRSYRPSTVAYETEPVCSSADGQRHMNLLCPVSVEDQPEGTLPDIQNTEYAIEYLRNKSNSDGRMNPFFLGVGFYKPHIPFKFPKKYLDLYPIENMDLAQNNSVSAEFHDIAWNPWTDLREKDDVKQLNISFPFDPLPTDFQRLVRQGYYASLSYIDDQLGKLLQALEETGYAEHTTIVLLGDHGWSLGEHQEWSKYSNFEVSVRVPLLVYIPELMDSKKRVPFQSEDVSKYAVTNVSEGYTPPQPKYTTNELVELVDLFPTLAEIVDIAMPPLCRVYSTIFCSEGLTFYPLIEHLLYDPSTELNWKTAVFSQYPRPSETPQDDSDQPEAENIRYMGYSIRTARFRYTEWVEFNITSFRPIWPAKKVDNSSELYDHQYDPFEAHNVINKADYAYVVIELSRIIKRGWRHAMPPGVFDSPSRISSS